MSPEEAAALNDLEQRMAQHALDKAAIEAVVGPIFNNRAVLRHVPLGPTEAQERVLFHVCPTAACLNSCFLQFCALLSES